jgi:hypothetical protein
VNTGCFEPIVKVLQAEAENYFFGVNPMIPSGYQPDITRGKIKNAGKYFKKCKTHVQWALCYSKCPSAYYTI